MGITKFSAMIFVFAATAASGNGSNSPSDGRFITVATQGTNPCICV